MRAQIQVLLHQVAQKHNLALPRLLQPLRQALGINGPPVESIIEVLGKEETLKRIDRFLNETA